ncbi:hypothetical protein HELRODRAFT_177610 [Helobdella robusta]|uniref:Uncharacterized protein n=1 Tax=Helobdella robusta TaxID=6412 RepID=T1FBY1_HELRO|nr:hypothetical protein HELRODRAFT_177610 [Helobdella robusta]ESN97946.1 hypothetical protein HELRODRAFT_177610 [Helobdella robusta]
MEIKEILYKQELYIAKLLENMNINYVNYLASKVSSNLLISGTKTSHCNEVEKSIVPKLLEKSSDLIIDVNNQNFNPGNLWSDAEKTPAEKNLIKKTVFLMSNVKRCHRNDVIDFLKTSGINVISCFPVIKRSNQEISDPVNKDEEESTMFRVCVESCDGPKMKDPEIMLKHIIVREWRFGKNTDKNSDTTNKHG